MKKRPEIFQNERVSASAGSGKTYALTKRFIALALKEIDTKTELPDPTRITALTFTRKSAGEFLGKILTRLADASTDPIKAKNLSLEIEELSFGEQKDGTYITQEKAQLLLKQCVKNLNRLRLSTIDSFFSSALQAFSNESGIFSDISIIDTAQRKEEKEKIIEDILRTNSTSKKTFANFAETVKRASFGTEEKSLEKTLKENIDDSHKKFIEVPNPQLWGRIDVILNEPPLHWDKQAYTDELNALKNQLKNENCGKAFDGIVKFLETTDNNTVGKVSTSVERTVELFESGHLDDSFEIQYQKKTYVISKETALLLNSLYKRISHAHILRVADASKATAEIAMMFENRYANDVRLAGKLSFDDIPILLNSSANAFSKLIEYRLDARFKHWLFDEFQDTSRQQWNFFKNIIDETVSNNDGEKTFYYVGDVKQSLYSWRGGDRLLFDEVFSNYNTNSEYGNQVIFDGAELVTSWRSGKNVIDIINSVFADEQDLKKAFCEQSASDFKKIFSPHISAETLPNAKPTQPSLAQLRLVENAPRDSTTEMQNICEEIFNIIKDTNPVSTGRTCAILVNNNDTAQTIVEYLRARIADEKLDIEVSGEMEKKIAIDNMLASAFIQLLKFVAHPSDSAAKEYLKMTPLADFAMSDDFRMNAISTIASHGFERFAENVENFLKEKTENFTQQHRENLERIKNACREFDNSQSLGIDNFLEFLYEKKYRLTSQSNAIQVMTIHKSKGLGFGTVILPDLHKIKNIHDKGLKYITQKQNGVHIQKTISYFPPQIICQMNPVLKESLQIESENESFENICKLYVALTRAERALYIVIPKLTNYEPKNTNIRQLLINTFAPTLRSDISPKEKKEIYADIETQRIISVGNVNWFSEKKPLKENNSVAQIEPIKNPQVDRTFELIVPSKASNISIDIDVRKIELGNAIHKAFEHLDDSENSPEEKVKHAIKLAKISDDYAKTTYQYLTKALSNPEIKKLFLAEKNQIIKTEFSFEVLIENKIARGTIDRLLVKTDDNATPISAVVIDFKSNGKFANTYKAQLDIYKTAIQNIFKIEPNMIELKVVSYSDATIVSIS